MGPEDMGKFFNPILVSLAQAGLDSFPQAPVCSFYESIRLRVIFNLSHQFLNGLSLNCLSLSETISPGRPKRSDGIPVSVPIVAPQGLAILLADAAT
nr:hypothetical protein [Tanacetum cinerariifolium]